MDDAWATVSSEQTLTPDDAALPRAVVSVGAPTLAAAEDDGADVLEVAADVLGAAADDFDVFEHAAADMVTSTRLAAVNTVENRMTSPRFRRSTVASATER